MSSNKSNQYFLSVIQENVDSSDCNKTKTAKDACSVEASSIGIELGLEDQGLGLGLETRVWIPSPPSTMIWCQCKNCEDNGRAHSDFPFYCAV